jgi:cell division inhibitor SulA/protein ImuA
MARRVADNTTREQLAQFCQRGAWRGDAAWRAQPSGYPELDAHLPGGGWPIGSIAELMPELAGIGELRLVTPALVAFARAGRYIAWIAPPLLPYAPALAGAGLPLERVLIIRTRDLKESLWATEQTLRCPLFGAVLGWAASITDRNVRRLQLAAEAGGSLGILYRPPQAARELSPAALRLRLSPLVDGLMVEIQKVRGGRAGRQLRLSLPPGQPQLPGIHGGMDGGVGDALALHTPAAARP